FVSAVGCDSNVTVILTTNPLPDATLSGLAPAYCADADSIVLVGEPAGGTFYGEGISGDIFSPVLLAPGNAYTIQYIYTDISGCADTATAFTFINTLPDISITLPEQVCIESGPVEIVVAPEGGVVSGLGVTENYFTPSIAGVGGPYTITYTYTDINGCAAQNISLILVTENYVDAGPDRTINYGDSVFINAETIGSVTWSPETGLNCLDCIGLFAAPLETTVYTVLSIDANGCVATDEITIFVNPYDPDETFFVPNAFTPNGDGKNDYFFIYGPDIDFIEILQIFDRWGVLMYSTENVEPEMELKGWDGTFHGQNVNSGVYAWSVVIRLKGNKQIHGYGNVTLLR
ncbi:MAG: gliding motility-associated C-terminal domain-containing protein, partial [Chitinophagales bacterium]